MDATIESDTSQNKNSLMSSGYLIKNYSEDDSDKDNNSTNKWLPFWNLLKTKKKPLHSEEMDSRLYHFHHEQTASR